jgi:phosphoribosylaminoimidazole-succinocarboxamide synthase
MSTYQQLIKRVTRCSDAEAIRIEDVMRNVIFSSTLDWQTREELESAARLGCKIVRQMAAEEAQPAK